MNFENYWNQNPRKLIPVDMEHFLQFATIRYKEVAKGNFEEISVDGVHCDDEIEAEATIREYIGDSMEAVLLMAEYIKHIHKIKTM